MDWKFVQRVYRTSEGVWLFILLLCWAYHLKSAAIGVTIGFAAGIGSLYVLQITVQTLFTPDRTDHARKSNWVVLGLSLFKYAVIGVVIWLSLRSRAVSIPGLAVGFGLPQAVIFLKALGIYLTPGADLSGRS